MIEIGALWFSLFVGVLSQDSELWIGADSTSLPKGLPLIEAVDNFSDAEVNNTMSMFRQRPPPFSIIDAGEAVEFRCEPASVLDQTEVTLTWYTPPNLPISPRNLTDVTEEKDDKDIFISQNNSLVIPRVSALHRGRYACILYSGENVTAVASMWLHVVDLSDVNYTQGLFFGLASAALCSLLITAGHFLLNRKTHISDKQSGLEVDNVGETQPKSAEALLKETTA